jgi:DNA-binding beta-propeller fold protein YncE
MTLPFRIAAVFTFAGVSLMLVADNAQAEPASILAQLPTSAERIVSTVPHNGDVNPYGVAFVPQGFPEGGLLEPGDILVSNFNNNQNEQGTGTTIVKITKGGQVSVFFHGPKGLGLTTALGVLRAGYVLVGNLPTTDGTSATVQQGSLLVIDRFGKLVITLANASLLDGPWDLTVNDLGSAAHVFVSNVLSGTVTRLDIFLGDGLFYVYQVTQIGSGYTHRTDPNALVIGPTGLAYDATADLLYVASTGDNEIFAISSASLASKDGKRGKLVYSDNTSLHGPLGLTLAPNGNLITANGDAINPGGTQNALVEFTPTGQFVGEFQVDPGLGGGAFGLAFSTSGDLRFAAVDDDQNTLDIWDID